MLSLGSLYFDQPLRGKKVIIKEETKERCILIIMGLIQHQPPNNEK